MKSTVNRNNLQCEAQSRQIPIVYDLLASSANNTSLAGVTFIRRDSVSSLLRWWDRRSFDVYILVL